MIACYMSTFIIIIIVVVIIIKLMFECTVTVIAFII